MGDVVQGKRLDRLTGDENRVSYEEIGGNMDEIKAALAEYGATLTPEGFIERNGVTGIKIVQKRGRFRYADAKGNTFATGPATKDSVRDFVEKFWFWKKVSS